MVPPLAASLFGGLLADRFSLPLAGVHLLAVFFGLYTAHLKDGYVDFYGRDEDDDHPLSERGCRLALAGASVGFFLATIYLVVLVDVWAGLITLPGWLIGYHHAPQLDMHPVTASVGYPTGIAFALPGGFYVQTTGVAPVVVALAVVFLVVLSGIKVIDDATDVDYDRSIDKRTVAVALGPGRARRVAYALMFSGMLMVLVLAIVASTIPPSGAVAALAFGLVAVLARNADAELATMLLIRGSYVFLALLLAAVWFRPLT
jgi:1,4-dihydroxy-2-naphthoate octaprenyltransferase